MLDINLPILGIYPRERKQIFMNVHISIIHSSSTLETIQISVIWWMDKQNEVYLYIGILLSNKKEGTTDTCYNMNKLQKRYVHWKEPDAKDYMFFLNVIVRKRQVCRCRKQMNDFLLWAQSFLIYRFPPFPFAFYFSVNTYLFILGFFLTHLMLISPILLPLRSH